MQLNINIDYPSQNTLIIAAGLIGSLVLVKSLVKFYFNYKKNQKRLTYPKDVVVLHQFPFRPNTPSISGPCLKLETWSLLFFSSLILFINKLKIEFLFYNLNFFN
jgi:hypothetical protein